MNHTNPDLLGKIIKKLKILTFYKVEKTKLLSETIAKYLQILPELKNYINENIPENESKIFFELGKYLLYHKYNKGKFIKHSYDSDNFFYMIFSGKVAKIDIKYCRVYLSFKEYLKHLIKLKLLEENYIYRKCIKKNKKVFPFDENINVLTTKEINIEHFQELINNIKDQINNSFWIKNKNNINIQDFLSLYNPGIINSKFDFIGKEAKYPTYLPIYIFDKILTPISFIGQLTRPKGIRFLSSYICLSSCDIFYIEKGEIDKNNNLYNLFQRRVSEDVVQKLFKNHFFFKEVDNSFLIKNYSKYFYVLKLEKGQKLIQQNTPYEGIFFIKDGIFQLKTIRSYNELNDLQFSVIHALDNFPKAYSGYQEKMDNIVNKNKNKEKNIYEGLDQEQIAKFTEKKEISFKAYLSHEIVGLNDLYDNMTGLNNFTVECLSDEAEVYYVPKEIVTSMLANDEINSKVGEFIGEQCLLHINEINKYKESFEQTIQFEVNSFRENKNIFKIRNAFIFKNNKNKNCHSINSRAKKNISIGLFNFKTNNINCSTNKSNDSINYFKTFNNTQIKNNSHMKINQNKNNKKYPCLKLNNPNHINKEEKNESLLDAYNETKIENNYYKTFSHFYTPRTNKSNDIKFQIHGLYLTDKKVTEKQKINEENKNRINNIKEQFNETFNENQKRNLLFNKTYTKGILKNGNKRYDKQKSMKFINNEKKFKSSEKKIKFVSIDKKF
jgi:CRP-like cAMP-binding protein